MINNCSNLLVFDCDRCSPSLLALLLLSKKSCVLAAAESKIAQISKGDFIEKAYPTITAKLDFAENEENEEHLRPVLRMIQVFCSNIFAQSHMAGRRYD